VNISNRSDLVPFHGSRVLASTKASRPASVVTQFSGITDVSSSATATVAAPLVEDTV